MHHIGMVISVTCCVTDTPRYRAVCDGPRDNPVVTDTPRYITRCVTDIDGGQAVFDGPRDNPVVTNTPRYITQCVTDIDGGQAVCEIKPRPIISSVTFHGEYKVYPNFPLLV